MKWCVFVFAGFRSVIDTSCEVLWLTISVSSSPGCPHRPQDSVPHKSQPRRFSEFLLHKKAVKKIENKMCVKITLMTRSAYTQPTPVTSHKSPGEAEVSRNLLVQVPEPLRVFGIKGEFKSSYATQTSKICFTYFLHSDRCQNIHTSSVHSRLRVECD